MNIDISIQTGERLNEHILAVAHSEGTTEGLEAALPSGSVEVRCGEFPEDGIAAYVRIEDVDVSENAESLVLEAIERSFTEGLKVYGFEASVDAIREPTDEEIEAAMEAH